MINHGRGCTTALYSYDYIVTLDQEINYVWTKKWSPSTLIFLANRYLAFALALWVLVEIPNYAVSVSLYSMRVRPTQLSFIFVEA